ncbi:hypothetical protein [Fulvimarina pelagi]|uniref:hypothetical protein n=1 Tax=Fulvimarina pelagi TaxID=217511 RepID=UPI0002FAD69E|nr:hypothetical protein [Fulvimarina pelagi]
MALIVVIAQLLVLQAVTAAYVCAGMDAAKASGTFILCHEAGTSVSDRAPDHSGIHDCCTDCFCAIGCGHPPSVVAASLDTDGLIVARLETGTGPSWPFTIDALGPRGPPRGLAYKRGPPALSA